jgi:hypothetical protein
MERRYTGALVVIAVAAFVLRLGFVLRVPTQLIPNVDSWSYYQRATNLIDRGRYEAIVGRSDATFPPGYPLLLAAAFSVAPDRLIAAKLVNSALGAATTLLIGLLGGRLFGPHAGLIGAVLFAGYPRAVMQAGVLASENLFTPLLLVWVWLFVAGGHASRGGFVLGLLTLTRAVAYGLWLPWAVAAVIRHRSVRHGLMAAVIVLVVQHAVLVPWAVRNYLAWGSATPLTSSGGVNLFIGNNPNASGEWYPWWNDLSAADPAIGSRSLADRERVARHVALAWMGRHPVQELRLYARKWRLMFASEREITEMTIYGGQRPPDVPVLPGPHSLKGRREQVDLFVDIAFGALTMLEVLGLLLWLAWPPGTGVAASFVVAVAFYIPAASAVFLAAPRFRWPATDLLLPFAGLVVTVAVGRRWRRDGRS